MNIFSRCAIGTGNENCFVKRNCATVLVLSEAFKEMAGLITCSTELPGVFSLLQENNKVVVIMIKNKCDEACLKTDMSNVFKF